MRQIAIDGKGGIGKSMVSSHITFALENKGLRVMHVGCDPKHDSTRLLLKGKMPRTVLDTLRKKDFNVKNLVMDEVVYESALNDLCSGHIYCAESGGPEPGIGCGGKGVVEAIEALKHLNVFEELKLDVVLYDVLGDVVCGGFSMPIREGHANEVYIVSSGELEVLFAASNICKAVARFNARSGVRLWPALSATAASSRTSRPSWMTFPQARRASCRLYPRQRKDQGVLGQGPDAFPARPRSGRVRSIGQLADSISNNKEFAVPASFTFEELHAWWAKAAGRKH